MENMKIPVGDEKGIERYLNRFIEFKVTDL